MEEAGGRRRRMEGGRSIDAKGRGGGRGGDALHLALSRASSIASRCERVPAEGLPMGLAQRLCLARWTLTGHLAHLCGGIAAI